MASSSALSSSEDHTSGTDLSYIPTEEEMRWPVFIYCVVGMWVRYGSYMRIRYRTGLLSFITNYCIM